MTTLTKMIDIRLTDYEVEIEIDEDDLSECDADDLWEALRKSESVGALADRVIESDNIISKIIETMDPDDLADKIDKGKIVEEALDEMDTDERKQVVLGWLGDEPTESGIVTSQQTSLAVFLRERLLPEATLSLDALKRDMEPLYFLLSNLNDVQQRSCLNHLTAVMPDTNPVGERVRQLLASASVTDVLRCMSQQRGAAVIACNALAVALNERSES